VAERRDRDWPTATAFLPEQRDLAALQAAAQDCRGCPLGEPATQTVFGRGTTAARLALVGEQPGDVEDQRGLPFVGPAGRLLIAALDEAGVDRSTVYVSNAVKHFKFETRGKRRIHQTPDAYEVAACRPWLIEELRVVDPELTVCLGATAAKALLGPAVRVLRDRGVVTRRETSLGERAFLVTVHPSSILRTPDDARADAHAAFVADLRVARDHLA
jgi:uracil-DNA glycosylase family protein